MITQTIINFIIGIVTTLFGILPTATLDSLPIIGSTISDTIQTMVETWNAFMVTVPYAIVLWNVFIYVIIPFEIILLVTKAILGSRVPAHTTN